METMGVQDFDVVIVGAGAAGLMCALQAGRAGKSVLLLDHNDKVGAKILISGGGRCNFTNLSCKPENFVSKNPHFCKSALSRYEPRDFVEMLHQHGIEYYEKKLGQLFCKNSARQIVQMLVDECRKAGVEIRLNQEIRDVKRAAQGFILQSQTDQISGSRLVIATGGLSIPRIGASSWGYEIAQQWGLRVTETAPALDGFVFTDPAFGPFKELSGISLDCEIRVHQHRFRESLLFTHVGLSGPAALQASLHWRPGEALQINLLPDLSLRELLAERRNTQPSLRLPKLFQEFWVHRFAEIFIESSAFDFAAKSLGEWSKPDIEALCRQVHEWTLRPSSTVGYSKAEVTRGGIDTEELSSKTMECKKVPGLYFIGEVVDVTGWLGGYNFQWAWASAVAAAQSF
jgi:predicted Rossmann fold flavoprotein